MNPSRTTEPEIMLLDEVAIYLRCHPSTIYRMLKQGKMKAVKIGSDWRFERAYVLQWVKDNMI
jgi:excisionase family DNA binding protein